MELIIERKGSPEAYVTRSGGGPVPQARIGITLDGYSAPLTAGSFAANVQDGVYDGKPVNASYASVLAGRGAIPGPSADSWADLKHLALLNGCVLPCCSLDSSIPCLTNAGFCRVSCCAVSSKWRRA